MNRLLIFCFFPLALVAQPYNTSWLNASRLITGYVPSIVLGTNSGTDGDVLVKSGNKVRWGVGTGGAVPGVTVTNITIVNPGGFTNLNLATNSLVATDANKDETTILNATGVLVGSAAGPPSFGVMPAAGFPALTGDVTSSAGSLATTLASVGTAGTYRSVTFDAKGRETSGSNPTTFSGYGISDTTANLMSALTTKDFWAATNLNEASIVCPTNGVSSASAVDFSVPEAITNTSGAVGFTSLSNWNPTNINRAIRYVLASGADRTVTVGTWRTDSLRTTATTYTATNNNCLALLFTMIVGVTTNVNAIANYP